MLDETNPNLEDEIKLLEQKLTEKRDQLTNTISPETARDVIKESIGDIFKEATDSTSSSGDLSKNLVQTQPNNIPSKIRNLNKDNQIEFLVKTVFSKSIFEAVTLAQKLNSPYILDELHDTLVNKFYEELVRRGKI